MNFNFDCIYVNLVTNTQLLTFNNIVFNIIYSMVIFNFHVK